MRGDSREIRAFLVRTASVVAVALFAGIVAVIPVGTVSASDPSITWATTDNTTVSGVYSIRATASGTADISKWCLTIDGQRVTSDVSTYSSQTTTYNRVYYDTTFNPADGCWTRQSSSYDITGGQFTFDSTAWTNGTRTYQITVTDTSGRTATSSVLTVNHTNENPSITWITTDNTTTSGRYTIRAVASAASSGTADISKWCLTINGQRVTSDVSTYSSQTTTYNRVYYDTTFNPADGCWTRQSSSYDITGGQFTFDSTAWTNGTRTYQITVTDTSGRTATSAPIRVKHSNPQPKITITGIKNGSKVSGFKTVKINFTHPNAEPVTWCIRVSSGSCQPMDRIREISSTRSQGIIELDTRFWKNGRKKIRIHAVDSLGRVVRYKTIYITSNNPKPKVLSQSIDFDTLYHWSSSASATLTVTTQYTSTLKVTARPANGGAAITKTVRISSSGSAASQRSTVSFTGLDPATTYNFSISPSSKNGKPLSTKVDYRTPRVPDPPPAPSSSGGGSSGGGSSNGSGSSGSICALGTRLDRCDSLMGFKVRYTVCGGGNWTGVWRRSNWYVIGYTSNSYVVSKSTVTCKK